MAVTPARVYRVDLAGMTMLVRAPTQAQALAHAARGVGKVRVASQDDLIELVASGIKPVTAGEEPPEPPRDPQPQA